MFWERFYNLCQEKNMKPLQVVKELNIAAGLTTKWKTGTIPNGSTLSQLADYFNVSVDYLLGKTNQKERLTTQGSEQIEDNVVVFHRDGKTVTKKFTPAQMELIEKLLNEIPEDK